MCTFCYIDLPTIMNEGTLFVHLFVPSYVETAMYT